MNKKFAFLSVILVVALVVVGSAFLQPQRAEAATSASNAARLGLTASQYSSLSSAFYLLELHTEVVSLQSEQAVLSMQDELAGLQKYPITNPTANELAAENVEVYQIGVRVNQLTQVVNTLNQVKSLENTVSKELYN